MWNSQIKKDVADLKKQTMQNHTTLSNRIDTNVGETRKHEEEIIGLEGRVKSLEYVINKFISEQAKKDEIKVFMPDNKKSIRKSKVKPKKV